MRMRRFSEAGVNPCVGTGVHNFGNPKGLIKPPARKEKLARPHASPISPKQLKQFGRQRNQAIFVPLSLHNPNHHALAVDIADAQVDSLADSHAGRIEC
jgi:hypothetical protein